jgi:hypothetical protein
VAGQVRLRERAVQAVLGDDGRGRHLISACRRTTESP